jgi:hypothetical protein
MMSVSDLFDQVWTEALPKMMYVVDEELDLTEVDQVVDLHDHLWMHL